ncbi:hypothetical protein KUTeg_004914 [Tegillarca granosa]|uniref:Uncharacterized protein n=1 Tax=Tegillarca granosa TaxID=220873 RepID=A0ABQ9FMU5_TEGGR|nr:hypothetical protein KUTeg_004914 [Tegillarca granosa]
MGFYKLPITKCTFELSTEGEDEVYEVINIGKIKAHTPNLRIVNLYGISFIDDSHIELLASNCIHLECLALNFCLRVRGASFKMLLQRCKKIKTLLLQHTGIEDQFMQNAPWEMSQVHELDLTSTELSSECLENILLRMPYFTYLALGYCEFFSDRILELMVQKGKLKRINAIDISHTNALSENAIYHFLMTHGGNLEGLMCAGKPKLTENFWLNVISFLKNIKICVLGTANGWFLRIQSKIHLDQVIEGFAQNCPRMQRLEIQWDPDTIRFSDKSNKFVDHLR